MHSAGGVVRDAGGGLRSLQSPLSPAAVVAALGVGFTGVMCWLAVRELAEMRSDLGDLAVYVQALWMTMHGQFMQFTMGMDPPGDYLGLHFSPILIALAPLSLAFRDPSYLSVLQVIGLALGAIPIALWAGKRLGHPAAAPVFALAFFLNPVVIGSILIPFHEIVFATAALGAMLYCQLNRRWWLTLLFALLALSVKEEIGFVV